MSPKPRTWKHVIGIVGGLGPHAHLQLERAILDETRAETDQDYPEWVLTSMPQTPDRTEAIQGRGPSPAPYLARAIRLLSARAGFAVVPCVTAHHFLPEVRRETAFPVLDMVEESLRSARRAGAARIGLLATTGTLESRIFERAADRVAGEIELLSPLALGPDGERLQEDLVMGPIYRGVDGGPSLKAGGAEDPEQRRRLARALGEAAGRLVELGAQAIVLGCTEIPLALGRGPVGGVAVVDPIRVAAAAAVDIARGARPLPPV